MTHSETRHMNASDRANLNFPFPEPPWPEVEVPEEIEHLDFESEKEEDLIHHRHPTIASLAWCGSDKNYSSFMSSSGTATSGEQTCPRCVGLIRAFGRNWYWETHRKHFGSNCTAKNGIIYHDCEA